MQDDISGWTQWQQNFSTIDELSGPSELHGLLTGILCVTDAPSAEQWQMILASLNIPSLPDEALRLLTEEAEDLAHLFAEEDYDFFPILPDDEHGLAERVQALADWCAGVVLGFGLASGHIRRDEQEWIEHLQDVAAVEFADDDDDEEGELSYQELLEFVRLVPASLSVGRQKVAVDQSTLLNHMRMAANKLPEHAASEVVEMYTPDRPS
ncbi:UPF0149 family protein [Acinetobacter larvae]|uniref:YecA family protein n=1 Tax=Acinetobacter larvae TaxID=1789224 RepID=A0A1B2M124_9GAMM|nr:UPF0149 family protein [Acinetobacter larvae]AOA58897.1 hypothetical protein BFG52_11390 [Acinetobacter larvae]